MILLRIQNDCPGWSCPLEYFQLLLLFVLNFVLRYCEAMTFLVVSPLVTIPLALSFLSLWSSNSFPQPTPPDLGPLYKTNGRNSSDRGGGEGKEEENGLSTSSEGGDEGCFKEKRKILPITRGVGGDESWEEEEEEEVVLGHKLPPRWDPISPLDTSSPTGGKGD